MVIQMRAKGSRVWRDYPGKQALGRVPANFEWRLLNKTKKKVLWPRKKDTTTYKDVLSNMRRIEFFKHRAAYPKQLPLRPQHIFTMKSPAWPKNTFYQVEPNTKKGEFSVIITEVQEEPSGHKMGVPVKLSEKEWQEIVKTVNARINLGNLWKDTISYPVKSNTPSLGRLDDISDIPSVPQKKKNYGAMRSTFIKYSNQHKKRGGQRYHTVSRYGIRKRANRYQQTLFEVNNLKQWIQNAKAGERLI